MAEAAAAWDWFQDNKNEITDDAKRGMLNAIAAAQQALYRTFQDWKGRDRLQEQYHGPIRDEAGPLGYLVGLNRQTSDAQIDALAQGLGQAWETAKQEADNRQGARRARGAADTAAGRYRRRRRVLRDGGNAGDKNRPQAAARPAVSPPGRLP